VNDDRRLSPPANQRARRVTGGPVEALLLELDAEARQCAVGLEALGRLPRGFVQKRYLMTPRELREHRRLCAALVAARDVDAFVALARGEAVPASRLRTEVRAAHNRRLGQ
jgi:hypothetical protein